ncbi:MAG: hypothetical protein Q4D38_04600 [Planctomycetia bacterium]|nr:hypothetical protein [Planctomycetia bacterium]
MPQHALAEIQKAGKMDVEFSPHLLFLEGSALFQERRYSEALYPLGQAVLLEPTEVKLWLLIGSCQKRIGRCDLAIESLENALVIQPNSTVVLYNLAMYHALAQQETEALKYLARCFFLDPQFKEHMKKEPCFDRLRDNEAFRDLMRERDEDEAGSTS